MILDEILMGKSTEGALMSAYVANGKWNRYVYFLAGILGDEVDGVYVLQNLIEELAISLNIQELPIVIIPTFNIDGHTRLLPHNSYDIDLSNHFLAETQKNKFSQETLMLMNLCKKFPPSLCLNFTQGIPRICYIGQDARFVGSHLSKYLGLEVLAEKQSTNPEKISTYFQNNFQAGTVNLYLPVSDEETRLKDIWNYMKYGLLKLFRNEYLKKYTLKT